MLDGPDGTIVNVFPPTMSENELDAGGFWVPLLMSLVAGAATTIGALFVLFLEETPKRHHMSFSLALAAGVMITVSLFDMYIPFVREAGFIKPSFAAALGALSFAGIMKLLPNPEKLMLPMYGTTRTTPHGHGKDMFYSDSNKTSKNKVKQWRLGMIMMVTLTAHNFPEGLAVSVSNLKSENLGIVVTLAIALHNIPEGLSIAVPIYAATGRKRYAILMALLSGLSEPLGSFVALAFLHSYFVESPWLVNYVLCFVAGIMTSVSFHELIPEALSYSHRKSFVLGFSTGFAVMILTIYLQPE